MIKIVELKQTCVACPSQWDAWDDEDNYYYIRYRWGHLTITIHEVCGELIFEKYLGGAFDGYLELDKLKEITKDIFQFDLEEEENG